jgi:hydroxypyruvate isomerase
MIQQSVCAPILKPAEVPYERFIPEIKDMGFKAIEFWSLPNDIDHIHALTQQHGLAIASFTGHDDIEHGMNDPSQHKRILKELETSIRQAHKYGVHGIICFSGSKNPSLSTEQSIQNCADCLNQIAPLAAELNVLVNLELLNSLVDHPGYECSNTLYGVQVAQAVSHPNVKLLFDIYHMQIMEGNLITNIRENIDWIGHFHTAGVPGRFDLDDEQEINYQAVAKTIDDTSYSHYVGHEFHPKHHYLKSLKQAYNVCNVQ